MRVSMQRNSFLGLSLGLATSLSMMANMTYAGCTIPVGATAITSCCDTVFTNNPCGVPINKNYLRSFSPPIVTVTVDPNNPNNVTYTTTNGSYFCTLNGACTGPSCSVGTWDRTVYYSGSPITITPLVSKSGCNVTATWSAGCGFGSHKEYYSAGNCAFPPQTKPDPVPSSRNNPLKLTPTCTVCEKGKPDPVDPYSGDYFYDEADLEVPGLIPLRAVRSYTSSKSGFTGPFGVGTHLAGYNYSITFPTNSDGTVKTSANQTLLLDEGNGLTTSFTNGASGGLVYTNTQDLGPAGSSLTLTLNASNFLASAVYKTAEKNQFQFDANGRLSQSQDEHGNAIIFTRDSQGKLLTASTLGSHSLTFTYNAANLIQDVTDHTGRQVHYSYDSSNRLLLVIDPLENSTTYTWDSSNHIETVMDKRNNAWALNSYQSNGMIRQQTMFVGTTPITGVEYRLDAIGALTRRITDPLGNTREYTYDSHGLLVEEKDDLGHSTTTTYSANLFNGGSTSRYIEQTDALSHTNRVDLNTSNLPTTLTDANNQTVTITYDTTWTNKPATITDALNHTTTFTYDSNGNLTQITDPDNKTTTMTYNSRGQVLSVINALSKTTTYGYNSNGELTSITDPLSRVTSFAYDSLGRETTITDPKNQNTTFQYNANNWLTKITNAANGVTDFTYDDNGNLTSVKSPRLNSTLYTYDRHNRLVKITEPGSINTTFIYDNADRLTRITDPKNQQQNFTYDAANRLTQFQTKVGTTVQSTNTYTYDNANRLLTVGDGTDTWTMAYDVTNRITEVVSPQGTVDYTYNANHRRTGMTATGQSSVSYVYDVLNRLTSMTQGAQTYGYTYDAVGRRTGLTRPNGVATSYTYDDANQLTQIHHLKTGTLNEQQDYTYDNNGNILTSLRDNSYTRTYTYDALNRLTKMVKSPVPGEALPKQIDWIYDADSDITQRKETDDSNNITTYAYTYNTRDFLTQRTTNGGSAVTYTYDSNGNLTGDGSRTFTWNALDQLTQLVSGGVTSTYAYDPLGRRKQFAKGGTTKNYFYDALDILSDGSNKYLHGSGIDEHLQLDTGTTVHHYLADQLGSTTRLTSSSGSSSAQYLYDPYGSQLSSSSPLSGNPFTYTGREDDQTGLLYYRARYYDPQLEVFISQDPMGDAQRYVGGNPLSFVDPLGLDYWIEGSVPGEGGHPFHQSFCVGQYGGSRACNGFGIDSRVKDANIFNASGIVYRDSSVSGKIVSGTYVKTSSDVDARIKHHLDRAIGKLGSYNVMLNNCRTYSDKTYQQIHSQYYPNGNYNFLFGLPSLGRFW